MSKMSYIDEDSDSDGDKLYIEELCTDNDEDHESNEVHINDKPHINKEVHIDEKVHINEDVHINESNQKVHINESNEEAHINEEVHNNNEYQMIKTKISRYLEIAKKKIDRFILIKKYDWDATYNNILARMTKQFNRLSLKYINNDKDLKMIREPLNYLIIEISNMERNWAIKNYPCDITFLFRKSHGNICRDKNKLSSSLARKKNNNYMGVMKRKISLINNIKKHHVLQSKIDIYKEYFPRDLSCLDAPRKMFLTKEDFKKISFGLCDGEWEDVDEIQKIKNFIFANKKQKVH